MLTVIKHKSLSPLKMHSIYCGVISLEDGHQQKTAPVQMKGIHFKL